MKKIYIATLLVASIAMLSACSKGFKPTENGLY